MVAPGTLQTTILADLSDGSCRTIDELATRLPLNRRQISDGAAKLIMRGFLERVEIGCYRLNTAGIDAALSGVQISSGPIHPDTGRCRKPQRQSLRQRAWNVMRMSSSFSIPDLLLSSTQGVEADANGNLTRYCKALSRAGYLIELPIRQAGTALTSNGFKRYRLLKDTGPIAPVLRPKKQELFDHNLGDNGEVVAWR